MIMVASWPFGDLLRPKARRRRATNPTEGPDRSSPSRYSSEVNIPEDILPRRRTSNAPQTCSNALKVALTTLSLVAGNIPCGAILCSIIDPLLDVTNRIDQASANTQGFMELTARIEALTPIVCEMSENEPDGGRVVVEALQREIQSITKDLNDALSQNRLERFFNSTDTASSLAKHNMTLSQLIADSTFVSVHGISKAVRELERFQSLAPIIPQGQIETGDIRGGLGGTGGTGHIGGQGGEGEGPKLEMSIDERWKLGNIYGGTGGTGGDGVEVGGKGGTGKAPVLRILRGKPIMVV
ncbi:hypothetical protein FB451DRAFT_1240838 [Mycena latifolia]|nr:hypothetical protein FB451DRAFT_1240838 [Mycena latifolia]